MLFKVPCSRTGVGVGVALGVLEVALDELVELELVVGGGLDEELLVVVGRAFEDVVVGGGGGVDVFVGVWVVVGGGGGVDVVVGLGSPLPKLHPPLRVPRPMSPLARKENRPGERSMAP